jgi:hypothetical protein
MVIIMKKIKRYIIPVSTLVIFIVIMTSGGLLKKSFNSKDNVLRSIEELKTDVLKENWLQAETDIKKLKTAWLTIEKRVQFSMELDELNTIDTNIARIEGALLVKDKSYAIIELSEMVKHWNKLEK